MSRQTHLLYSPSASDRLHNSQGSEGLKNFEFDPVSPDPISMDKKSYPLDLSDMFRSPLNQNSPKSVGNNSSYSVSVKSRQQKMEIKQEKSIQALVTVDQEIQCHHPRFLTYKILQNDPGLKKIEEIRLLNEKIRMQYEFENEKRRIQNEKRRIQNETRRMEFQYENEKRRIELQYENEKRRLMHQQSRLNHPQSRENQRNYLENQKLCLEIEKIQLQKSQKLYLESEKEETQPIKTYNKISTAVKNEINTLLINNRESYESFEIQSFVKEMSQKHQLQYNTAKQYILKMIRKMDRQITDK